MANAENLKPVTTKSEARTRGKAGGKASGEARRAKKQLREYMNLLLDLPVSNTKDFNKLSRMGIPPEEIDNKMMLTAALFQRAVKTGDVAAVREIRAMIGDDAQEHANGQLECLLRGMKE